MAEREQLLIPGKIKVGFQKRSSCYTGKLGYVIYYDAKGVLRKEKSWQGWRDKKIEPVEFENVPTEGFVLNRKVGGTTESWGWNVRQEYCRVYDPRDFEFEIKIPNLLFILRETDCSRGKGLEGKFVYSWDGPELVLLPVGSNEYKKSSQFTALQSQKVSAKDLKPGCAYLTKKQKVVTYLGRFEYHFMPDHWKGGTQTAKMEKRHVFWDDEKEEGSRKKNGFVYLQPAALAGLQSDVQHSDFAALVSKYNKSAHGTPVKKLFLKEHKKEKVESDSWHEYSLAFEEPSGSFVEYSAYFSKRSPSHISYSAKYYIDAATGKLTRMEAKGLSYKNPKDRPTWSSWYGRTETPSVPWREPTYHKLVAELESGAKFDVETYTFAKE